MRSRTRYGARGPAAAVALLAIIAPVVIAGGGEEERAQVVIGYQNIPNGEIIAKEMGWHEERIDAEITWVQVDSGRDLNTGIASGSIDLGLGGSSTTAAAIAQGLDAEVFFIYDIIGDNEALVVRSDEGIDEIPDLIGRTVAAPFGATTHYHLLVALEEFGVDPADLQIVDMQPPDLLAAFQRGDIDAGFVWEPTLARMLESGGEVLIASGELAARGYLTGDIGLVRREFAQEHPEIVVAYLENQIRAVEFYREDPAAAAQAIANQFEISLEEAQRQIDSLVLLTGSEQMRADYLGTTAAIGRLAEVLKATGDFLVTQDTIPESPDVGGYRDAINPSFLERAVANTR